jgi:transposase
MLHRRELFARKKRGECVGKTKRGKGTKWVVVADGAGVPLGVSLASASPAEVTLVEEALKTVRVPRLRGGAPRRKLKRLIADKAYDADWLRMLLANRGTELICPHRRGRKAAPMQDGRSLRRYRRRWIVERTIGWLGNFRRLLIRWERHLHMYRAFMNVACLLIAARQL